MRFMNEVIIQNNNHMFVENTLQEQIILLCLMQCYTKQRKSDDSLDSLEVSCTWGNFGLQADLLLILIL